MLAAILLIGAMVDGPKVIATFNDPRASREGLLADQIERSAGMSTEAFAIELVEAEGLKSWGEQDPISSDPGARLAWRARHAADGKEIVVYFVPGDRSVTANKVCRIRRSRGGVSNAHWRAIRWCAASFGITYPAKRAPIVYKN